MSEPRKLSVQEIQEAAESFKDDLMREMRRAARQHTDDSKYEAYACVKAEEVIDQFLYNLKMLASSDLREYLSRPARARAIHLSPKIIGK